MGCLSTTQLKLVWQDNSYNENGFKLERCQSVGCTVFTQIATTASNVSTHADNGLTPGESYSYRVRAYNPAGDSAYADIISVTLPPPPSEPPSNLLATAVDQASNQMLLTWSDTSIGEQGFKIERCQGAVCTNFAQISETGDNLDNYTDTGLKANTSYRYRIRAFNHLGLSNYSNIATGKTRLLGLFTPTDLTVVVQPHLTRWRTSVAWIDQAGVETGFVLERKKGPLGAYAAIATLPAIPGVGGQAGHSLVTTTQPVSSTCYRVRVFKQTAKRKTFSAYSDEACYFR